MALHRSIIDVEVLDEKFKAFVKQFNDYKKLLQSTSGDWRAINTATAGIALSMVDMTEHFRKQLEMIKKIASAEDARNRAGSVGAEVMSNIAKSARATFTHISESTTLLMRWTGLGAVLGGVTGLVGGAFAIDRLAGSASNLRSQGMQTFANPNAILGARVNWGPFFDPGAAMSAISGMQNVTNPALSMLGMRGMMNAPTDQVMNAMAQKAFDFTHSMDRSMWRAMPQWQIFSQVFGEGGMNAIGGMSAKEFQEHMARGRSDAAALGITDETLLNAQKFTQQLDRASYQLEYGLLAGLQKLFPNLENLSKDITDVALAFLKGDGFKNLVSLASDGLKEFDSWIKNPEFKQDVLGFLDGIKDLAHGIKSVVEWLKDNFGWMMLTPNEAVKKLVPGNPGFSSWGQSAQHLLDWGKNKLGIWTPPPPINGTQTTADPRGQEAAIRASAARWGVNPDDAVALARAEGLSAPYKSWDVNGYSYGGFQMHEGGLLDEFKKANPGIDPTDPKNEQALNDWAIYYGSTHGWSKWSAVTGGRVGAPRPMAPSAAPLGPGGSKSSAAAVDDMMRFANLSGSDPRVRQFIRENGGSIDPATTAWCAAFVNASLAHEGIQGSGANTASSFANWGVPVTGGIQKGDVALEPPGEGFTGHVGMLTGRTRTGPNGQMQYEFVSSHKKGDMSNPSGVDWRDASHFRTIRRAVPDPNAQGNNGEMGGAPGKQSYAQPVAVGVRVALHNQTGGSAIVSASQLA